APLSRSALSVPWPPPDVPGPRRARWNQLLASLTQFAWSFSNPTYANTADPQVPFGIEVFGSVPTMKISSIDLPPACGFAPVHGSILACPIPPGSLKSLIAHFFVTSSMKPCQTKVVTSIEKTGFCGVDTSELSLLPFQPRDTRANSPALRPSVFGGAMKPYALRSLASLFVPVFSVAGRRLPASFVSANLPQNGLTFGFVLPARMSVTMNAAWGDAAWVVSGGVVSPTGFPDAAVIVMIVVWGTSLPPLASVP